MKIRNRLVIYFTALVMTLQVLIAAFTYYAIYQYNDREFYNQLRNKAQTTAELLIKVQQVDSALLKTIDKASYDLLDNENISVYDTSGREIYTNNDTLQFKNGPQLFRDIIDKKYIRYSEGPYKIIGLFYADSLDNHIVTAGAIDDDGNALLRQVRIILTISLLASLLLVALLGRLFVGKALEPISAVINNVKHLSPVEHSERLVLKSEKDEIAELVATFNGLFDRLEDSFTLQKNFVANVSHELNNPLTKIKSQLQVSLLQNREEESYRQTIASVIEDVDELSALIHDLLNFSRLTGDRLATAQPVRIDELLFEVRDTILSNQPGYNIIIDLQLPARQELLIIKANKLLLATALKNLLENACKFSEDKSALLKLKATGSSLEVSVSDNGPGIEERELPFIFEPFYRSNSTETITGYGIGLALAYRILKAHNFPITVQTAIGKGTTFLIRIST